MINKSIFSFFLTK